MQITVSTSYVLKPTFSEFGVCRVYDISFAYSNVIVVSKYFCAFYASILQRDFCICGRGHFAVILVVE